MGLGVLGYFGDKLKAVLFTCTSLQVFTFKDVKVNRLARHAQHEVLGLSPVNEFVIRSLSTVSFNISISQDQKIKCYTRL